MIVKILKWAYGDTLKYVVFLVATFLGIAAFLTFINYPLQTVCAVVGIIALYALFCFVTEYK